MKRLTIEKFNFTSDFVASNLQSYPIAEALKKLQEYENAEEQGYINRCEKCGSLKVKETDTETGIGCYKVDRCECCGHE